MSFLSFIEGKKAAKSLPTRARKVLDMTDADETKKTEERKKMTGSHSCQVNVAE